MGYVCTSIMNEKLHSHNFQFEILIIETVVQNALCSKRHSRPFAVGTYEHSKK